MISRNAPCPCGSGLKYKRCHGATVLVPGTPDGPGRNRYGGGEKESGEYLHIVMPTRGAVAIETMVAVSNFGWAKDDYARLGLSRATFLFMPRMGVAQARERLAEAVIRGIEVQPDARHWVLWLDDDAIPTLQDITILLNEMRRNPDIGILSCYYSPKEKGHPGWVPKFGVHESALMVPGVDFQPQDIVEVPWVGLHCALMRGEILTSLPTPRFPFDVVTGLGEDVGFSHRIREAGWTCAVHAGTIVPHVDVETGEQFVPDVGSKRVRASVIDALRPTPKLQPTTAGSTND